MRSKPADTYRCTTIGSQSCGKKYCLLCNIIPCVTAQGNRPTQQNGSTLRELNVVQQALMTIRFYTSKMQGVGISYHSLVVQSRGRFHESYLALSNPYLKLLYIPSTFVVTVVKRKLSHWSELHKTGLRGIIC